MGFRHGGGRPRANGRRYASRNKEVQIPRRWHRRCCRAPQNGFWSLNLSVESLVLREIVPTTSWIRGFGFGFGTAKVTN
jgi:hypothetical protein